MPSISRRSGWMLALCLCVTLPLGTLIGAEPFQGRLVLSLPGALAQNNKTDVQDPKLGRELELYATCEGGVWTDVWGFAKSFNVSIHLGEVTAAAVDGPSIKLKVHIGIDRDNWIAGGLADYDLDLVRSGESITGTFSGVFTADGCKPWQATNNAVTGYVLPPNPVQPGFVPVKPGEHPRLLIRASELPALRERAKTPFGKAIIERLQRETDPVSLGFLYQMTGEKSYAERAFPETVTVMNNRNGGAFALGRFWGYRTNVVANAYDLCYDAWTRDQKDQVENYLDEIVDLCLNRKHRVGTVNWAPGSNYTVVIHSGNGAAALALMGEKCLPPAEPVAPRLTVAHLVADPAFAPGAGVPTVPLPTERTATEWIWTGPFNLHYTAGDDCLASMGGAARARPAVGDPVTFKQQQQTWRVLSFRDQPDNFVEGKDGPAGYGLKSGQVAIRTPKLAGGEQKRLFFYTVIDNPTAGFYRFKANFWNGACYINGERFLDGEILHLGVGKFPLLVPVIIGSPTGHASPVIISATEADATAYYADESRKKTYDTAKAAWDRAIADWKANDGVNQTWLRNVRTLTAWNYLNLQRGMGDGGFQGEGEGYTLECHHMPHDFACIYQHTMGKSLTGRPDISHFAARYVHDAFWRKDGKPFQQSYGGHGGGTMYGYYFARAIALAPEAWRPALLDHWLRLCGTTRDEVLAGPGAAKLIADRGHDDELTPIWVFLNYPLAMQPQSPQAILPKAWESKTRGYYSFRNGWQGDKDIVASIYAKQGVSCGWNQNEAGCFQIYGLGREWAYKSNDAGGKVGSRWLDNVVMLPEDSINAGGRARIVQSSLDQSTGSGVVTINMDAVYQFVDAAQAAKTAAAAAAKAANAAKAKGKTDDAKVEEAKADDALPPSDAGQAVISSGDAITGIRSFAADYSGAAGVPGLFAVVDKIVGGKKKIWVFQPPREKGTTVAIDGSGFTLTNGTTSLRATFVGAPGVAIAQASGVQKAHPASGIQDTESSAIHATIDGGAGGEFFVVFTLQDGPAPAVSVQGAGLGATATVGGQTVRFDGSKLVLGR